MRGPYLGQVCYFSHKKKNLRKLPAGYNIKYK